MPAASDRGGSWTFCLACAFMCLQSTDEGIFILAANTLSDTFFSVKGSIGPVLNSAMASSSFRLFSPSL